VQYAALDIGTRTDATNAGRTNANSNNNDVVLAGDIVTPHGFTVQQLPSQDPLDPQGLNTPISADEQQKTADALTLIVNGDTSALQPHPYRNLPHDITGAVLPPSALGYTVYDVPESDSDRGLKRLLVDNGTGAIYYTNNHYYSFYPIQMHPRGE
jgi:guanyl-specific ribonuclease Sa